MGKSTPQPPPPVDAEKLASATGAANKDTAIATARLNAVDQYTPYGSVTYNEIPYSPGTYDPNTGQYVGGSGGDPSVPRFQQNINLSPEQQALYNSTTAAQQQALNTGQQSLANVQGTLSSPFSLSGLPSLQTGASGGPLSYGINTSNLTQLPGASDFGAERRRVEDALMSRFNEDYGKQQENTISRLNNQGLQAGSTAYNDQLNNLERSRNDALAQAVLAGGQEQSRLFNLASQARGQQFGENQAQSSFYNTAQQQAWQQALQNASMQNQARQQSIGEQQLLRSQPINEFATLLGLGGNIQTPTGSPGFGVNVQPTDVMGAYGLQQQGLQNNYNQQLAANNAFWGGLGNLGGALGGSWILKSDKKSKNIIRRVGQTATGIPLYLYTYKAKPDQKIVGVIAQEVNRVMPHAVHEIDGILHVNYAEVA